MQVSDKTIGVLKRSGYLRGPLKEALDRAMGEVNLKDLSYVTQTRPFFYVGITPGVPTKEDVRNFLQGFTAEQVARSARWSYFYARYILHGRFEMGELTMQTALQEGWWDAYQSQVLGMGLEDEYDED